MKTYSIKKSTSKHAAMPLVTEPDAHVMMRHASLLASILLGLAVVATIACFLIFPPAAYLPAIGFLIVLSSLIVITYLKFLAKAGSLRQPGQKRISSHEIETDVEYSWFYHALAFGGAIGVGALLISLTLIDWANIGASAAILFCLAILFMFPFLPLIIQELANEERKKITPNSTPAKSSSEPTLSPSALPNQDIE